MMIQPAMQTNAAVVSIKTNKMENGKVSLAPMPVMISDDAASQSSHSVDCGRFRVPILPQVLVAQVASYCDVASLVQLLEASNDFFSLPVQIALSNQTSLSMSFLLQMPALQMDDVSTKHKNHTRKRKRCSTRSGTATSDLPTSSSSSSSRDPHPQERSLSRLLQLVGSAGDTTSAGHSFYHPKFWKRLEVSNLRHVTGKGWLDDDRVLFLMSRLQYLDLSGCSVLDPTLLKRAIVSSAAEVESAVKGLVVASGQSNSLKSKPLLLGNLRHLNLLGCSRVDCSVVMAIATNLTSLKALLLGGCSQTIDDGSICTLLNNLRDLEDLDLSGLKRLTEERTGRFLCQLLSETETKLRTLKLEACEQLRLSPLLLEEVVVERMGRHNNNHDELWWQERSRIWNNHNNNNNNINNNVQVQNPNIINAHKLQKIDFNSIGMPRRGLVQGALSYFARGGCLREVHVSGCEHIQDWEVQVLATYCGHSLTCLEMRACGIGNSSLKALAMHCKYLAELDVSACFRIGNEGCLALCGRICPSFASSRHVQPNPCTRLTSLKIASLPLLTNRSLLSMSVLRSLLMLDVHNCTNMTSTAVCHLAAKLPALIDLDARGVTNDDAGTLMTLLRRQERLACNPGLLKESKHATPYQLLNPPRRLPKSLRFVNNRPFSISSNKESKQSSPSSEKPQENPTNHRCCSVSQYSHRIHSAPLQAMVHCVDCKLLPSFNRGVCAVCAATCHAGHETFMGSYTRFSCDCSSGIAFASGNVDATTTPTMPCKAILSAPYGSRETIMQHVYPALTMQRPPQVGALGRVEAQSV